MSKDLLQVKGDKYNLRVSQRKPASEQVMLTAKVTMVTNSEFDKPLFLERIMLSLPHLSFHITHFLNYPPGVMVHCFHWQLILSYKHFMWSSARFSFRSISSLFLYALIGKNIPKSKHLFYCYADDIQICILSATKVRMF